MLNEQLIDLHKSYYSSAGSLRPSVPAYYWFVNPELSRNLGAELPGDAVTERLSERGGVDRARLRRRPRHGGDGPGLVE